MSNRSQTVTAYSWVVWALGATFFFIQYFPRVIPSIAAAHLIHEFQVDALALGSLAAFYLYAYVGMQVPVGMLYDRFGIKWLVVLAAIVASLGCVVFSEANTLAMAQVGRFLAGFGGAFGFVGALKLASLWFPPRYFGLLAGATQALGMFGAAIGQGPMSYLLHYIGWRTTLMVFALAFLVLALVISVVVRDRRARAHTPGEHTAPIQKPLGFWKSLWVVLQNPQSWLNAGYLALVYAPTMSFGALWGVSYLKRAFFLTEETAAMVISFIFFGWAVGGPIAGWLTDKMGKRKPVMLLSAVVSGIMLTLIIYDRSLSLTALYVCCFIYGVGNTGIGASYALSGEINPPRVAGTSMAFANMASIAIGTALQPFLGWLLVLFWDHHTQGGVPVYSAHDFQEALLILPICLVVGFIFALCVKDSYCKPVEE